MFNNFHPADILETNDAVVRVMEVYKEKFPDDVTGDTATASAASASSNMLDSKIPAVHLSQA